MVLDIQKREQLPCAQIMRIELQYLLELENRDIEIVGIAALERVIIASDRRCNIRDHLRAFIEHPQITVRKIVRRLSLMLLLMTHSLKAATLSPISK